MIIEVFELFPFCVWMLWFSSISRWVNCVDGAAWIDRSIGLTEITYGSYNCNRSIILAFWDRGYRCLHTTASLTLFLFCSHAHFQLQLWQIKYYNLCRYQAIIYSISARIKMISWHTHTAEPELKMITWPSISVCKIAWRTQLIPIGCDDDKITSKWNDQTNEWKTQKSCARLWHTNSIDNHIICETLCVHSNWN